MTNRSEQFAALADPTRRKVFERLSRRAMSVGDIASGFPVSRPAVSQHLKVLKDAGLVVMRPEGTRNVYQVNAAAIDEMRAYLDRFWATAMAAFKDAVEKETD